MEQLTVDVSSWMVEDEEWLGEQPKLWLSEPNWGPAPQRWLFKPARRGWLPQRGTGNLLVFHWQDAQSEVIASQLARTIGLPAAHVVPARRSEERGCISLDVRATGEAIAQRSYLLVRSRATGLRTKQGTASQSDRLSSGCVRTCPRRTTRPTMCRPCAGHGDLRGVPGPRRLDREYGSAC